MITIPLYIFIIMLVAIWYLIGLLATTHDNDITRYKPVKRWATILLVSLLGIVAVAVYLLIFIEENWD